LIDIIHIWCCCKYYLIYYSGNECFRCV
jgi:hypothetical protein